MVHRAITVRSGTHTIDGVKCWVGVCQQPTPSVIDTSKLTAPSVVTRVPFRNECCWEWVDYKRELYEVALKASVSKDGTSNASSPVAPKSPARPLLASPTGPQPADMALAAAMTAAATAAGTPSAATVCSAKAAMDEEAAQRHAYEQALRQGYFHSGTWTCLADDWNWEWCCCRSGERWARGCQHRDPSPLSEAAASSAMKTSLARTHT